MTAQRLSLLPVEWRIQSDSTGYLASMQTMSLLLGWL